MDIGRVMRGEEAYDHRIADYNVMKEMRWTKEELDRTPENDVMGITFIMGRTGIQAKKERKKIKDGRP